MTPQGTSLVDTTYIDNLIARASSVSLCSDLQQLATAAMASLQAHVTALEGQISLLLPFQALLEVPTDLGSALTWIEKLIAAQIQPAVTAYTNAVEQLAQITVKIAQLVSALEGAAARIVGCAVSVPTLMVTSS